MVIPDAIEPVVGWRCFDVIDGQLVSPQQRMHWPVGKRAEAGCGKSRWEYNWVQATTAEREEMEIRAKENGFDAATGHYVKYLMPDGSIEQVPVYMPWGMANFNKPITHYPDEGKEWVLIVHKSGHEAPHEGCHCGIHLAKDLDNALQYGHHGQGCFARVKGWGKVVPASHGFRVEFAYPEKLFFYSVPPTEIDEYQCEVASVLDCPEFFNSLGITWHG